MGNLFKIDDAITNKITYYHLLFLLASLPFDMFYSHVILISLAIHTIINLSKESLLKLVDKRVLILQSVFWVTLLSTIYTSYKQLALQALGGQIMIFIVPLVFLLNSTVLKRYRNELLMGFALVCTGTIIYLFINAFFTINYYHQPYSILFSNAFTNHNFSEPINIHATFFSMQIAIALVFLCTLLIKEPKKYKKIFYLICFAILTAGIIQLSSKSIFIALLVVFILSFPYFLFGGIKRLQLILVSVISIVLILVGIFSIGNFKARYITGLSADLSKSIPGEITDTRFARWQVTFGLIKKSPIIGHGAGSEIPLLQDGFFNHKLYNSFLNKLNTHSEYLSTLLKSGLIGLIIYVATIAFGLWKVKKQRDILFFAFLIIIAAVSVSENFLDVDKGIVFYSIFFSFFMVMDSKQFVDYQYIAIEK